MNASTRIIRCQLILAFIVLFAGGWLMSAQAQLPAHIAVTVDKGGGTMVELNLSKYSIRSTDFRVQSWDSTSGYVVENLPVRTYRGYVTENPNELVTALIDVDNTLDAEVHDGSGRLWTVSNVNLSSATTNVPPALPTVGIPASHLPATGSGSQALPEANMPPVEMYSAHGVYDIPSSKYKGSTDATMAWLEYQWNIHDFFNSRDGKLNILLTEVIIRKEQFYFPADGSAGQFNSMLHSEWVAQGINRRGFIASGFPTGFSYAGGYASGNNFYNTGGEAICVNALYHENAHNWGASHFYYGQDTQSGSHPAHGEMNVAKVLNNRAREITEATSTHGVVLTTNAVSLVHPYAYLDLATTLTNTPVNINVLTNDWDSNGGALSIRYFTTNTVQGGTVTRSGNVLTYTPANGYVGKDIIVYEVEDTTGLYTEEGVHIEVVNRGLAASWSFEEASGQTAADGSGNGHAGTLSGATFGAGTITGPVGNAIALASGEYVIGDNTDLIAEPEDAYPIDADASTFFDPMDESFTATCWFKLDDRTQTATLFSKRTRGFFGYILTADSGGLSTTVRLWDGIGSSYTVTGGEIYSETWYHAAMVINRTDHSLRLYLNGVEVGTAATLPADQFIFDGRDDLVMGGAAAMDLDEAKIYTKALSQGEVQSLVDAGTVPVGSPTPEDGAWRINPDADLAWQTPDAAFVYNVYFGTNAAAVASATTISAEYKGQVSSTAFDPGTMDNSTTYYWRVDAVTPSLQVIPGSMWEFTTVIDEADLSGNLVAHWEFSEGTGSTVSDSSGNSYNGSVVGGAAWTNGQFGGALHFDGTDDAVDLDSHVSAVSGLNQGTITTWFRTQGTGAHVLFAASDSNDGSSEVRYYVEGNSVRYDMRDESSALPEEGGNLDSPDINDGAWHHAAITVNTSNNAILYVDGVQVDAQAEPFFSSLLGINSMSIGRNVDSGGPQWHFVGDIDDLRIYDRTLTPAEIDHVALAIFEIPPVGHWPLDDASGSIATDISTYGRDGTVSGATWSAGYANSALSFDGSGDYVDLSAHTNAVTGFSQGAVSAWFRTSVSSIGVLFAASDSSDGSSEGRLFIEDGNIRYDFRDDSGSPDGESGMLVGPSVDDGQWHHVVVSVDAASAATMYLDGSLVGNTQEPWVGDLLDIDAMSLGRNVDSGGAEWHFNGDLDEVVLYRGAVSAADVQELYAVSGTNRPPVFTADPFTKSSATEGAAYSSTIFGSATDADSDPLTYSNLTASTWLNVAADGTLSGTPSSGDVGPNAFTVQADDGHGGTDTATLNITVDVTVEAATLVNVNFSHLSGKVGDPDGLDDGDRIEDVSGNGYHGFFGSTGGNMPIINTPNGTGIDNRGGSRGYIFLRDALTSIPAEWDGPTTTVSPYFTLDGNASFTLEAVVNWSNTVTSLNGIMGQTGGNEVWLRESGGYLHYAIKGSSADANFFSNTINISAAKADGLWHAIAVVYDAAAGEIRTYVDGTLLHTNTDADIGSLGTMLSGTTDFRLGSYNGASSEFDGLLDSFRITTAALAPNDFLTADAPPPVSAPEVTLGGPGGSGYDITLSWIGEAGFAYGVQTNADLVNGVWNTYTNYIGDDGAIAFTNDIDEAQMFFRIIAE